MSPTVLKSLLTFGSLVLGGASQMPGMNPMLAQALAGLAGILVGWAHLKQPS